MIHVEAAAGSIGLDTPSECCRNGYNTSESFLENNNSHGTTYHTRWLPSDDQKLLDLVNSFTHSNRIWKDVACNMAGRTAVQCRTRWNYKHNPNRKRKDVIMDHNSVKSVGLEKMIMLQVNHPFIVQMQYVFQRSYRVYFIMDFMAGGELFNYMHSERRFS